MDNSDFAAALQSHECHDDDQHPVFDSEGGNGMSFNRTDRYVQPRPKSSASSSSQLSWISANIKRIADEMVSRCLHKSVADLKQPWQVGPLAGLFSRPKPFWERMQVTNKMPSVGLSDHITASVSGSDIPKPIQHSELAF